LIFKAESLTSAPPIPTIASAPKNLTAPPVSPPTVEGPYANSVPQSISQQDKVVKQIPLSWRARFRALAARIVNNSTIVSFIVHVILLLLLAMWAFDRGQLGDGIAVKSGWDAGDDLGANFDLPDLKQPNQLTDDADAPPIPTQASAIEMPITDPLLVSDVASPTTVQIISPIGNVLAAQVSGANLAGGSGTEGFRGTNLSGRELSGRSERARKGGGSIESEAAVEEALQWFVRHQYPDGGWSLNHIHEECRGECPNPSIFQYDSMRAAATGLALLSFLGAGYTHQEGQYREEVRRGIYFLIQVGRRTHQGIRFPGLLAENAMYEQGIAALALCEAYQMTKDADLKDICQEAINYIRYAQHSDGGWDYQPRGPGDLSIGCWQMMAIKSATASNLKVPVYSIQAFDKFLTSQQSDGGALYGYRGEAASPAMTAIGLLMRMYRGMGQTDPALLRGIQYLMKNGPSEDDVYLNYYATQVLFHQQGRAWEVWNEKQRDYLVQTQSKQGHSTGSWFFPNTFSLVGGRHYCTAMNCMTLEVYYRVLPIYQEIEVDDFQF
jgi:hypothetical protein